MALRNVTLIEVGQPSWPRWMVYSNDRRRYWCKGTWKKRRRNGELWHNKSEAEKELAVARSSAEAS
jgi:hypothetical protein